MAPRGRNKKAGLQRIDAAFDALIPLGFSRGVIQKTIKSLLKAYGGDEGWVFIEEASYKLLIETILEQQEEEEHKHALEKPCKGNAIHWDFTFSLLFAILNGMEIRGALSYLYSRTCYNE